MNARFRSIDPLCHTPQRLEDRGQVLAFPETVANGEVARFLRGASEEEVAYAGEGEESALFVSASVERGRGETNVRGLAL